MLWSLYRQSEKCSLLEAHQRLKMENEIGNGEKTVKICRNKQQTEIDSEGQLRRIS